ncbi:SH3 domain-containing protein [Caenorhabditis elegans]|uniref:SH3 domain-containing protein n=1 Tax=Caenorhabditis elegans TaxID=6239 RepID=Q18204_CAEEL|nr:SH3 domain-containing protein [Caenorhabditis elegans]CAA96594.5 SH3 domain-containing protein [Caenorhabditis elegans]
MGIRSIFWKVVSGRVPDNGGWVDSMQVDHFDPYTPGQLTKNFTATVADEISVTRGTTVKAIYRDDQWIYVEVSDGRKGFVPQTYCKLLLNSKHGEKKKVIGSSATLDRRWEKSNLQRFIDSLPVQKEEGEVFKMDEICEVQILQSFDGSAPDDISVKDGESVTVLNISDPEWTYIRNSDNQSGFVPSSHVKIPHEILQQASRVIKEKWENENLLVVEPFSGRSPLDLTVRPGEWIKCTGRPVDDWLWAVRIADEKQGFIPNKVVILATDL